MTTEKAKQGWKLVVGYKVSPKDAVTNHFSIMSNYDTPMEALHLGFETFKLMFDVTNKELQ